MPGESIQKWGHNKVRSCVLVWSAQCASVLVLAQCINLLFRVSEVKDILTQRGTRFQFADSNSKSSAYSEEDIITSVKKLSKLGSGFRTIKVGRVVMIVSVPEELDDDHMQVMNLAEDDSHGPYGMVTSEDVSRVLGWDADRSKRALELLLGKGMVWLDLHRGESSYFFPSLWKQGAAARQ